MTAVIVNVILDLAIAAVFGWQAYRLTQLANQTRIARIAAHEVCINGNQRRAVDAARWQAIVKLIDTKPDNPSVQRFVAQVNAANNKADRPTVCPTP